MALALTIAYLLLTFVGVDETFPELSPYRILLIVGISGTVVTFAGVVNRSQAEFRRQAMLMAAFTGAVLLSSLPHGWFGGILVAFQRFMPISIVFFLTAYNIRSIRDLRILRLCLLALTLYLAGRGLYDYFENPDDSPWVLLQTENDVTIHRLQSQGVLGDPNAFAQFLLGMLPLLFVGMKTRSWPARICFIFPMAALMSTAIFYTYSRGALIGLVVLIGILARRRFRLFGGGLATAVFTAVLIAAGFAGGRSVSVGGGMDRLDLWSDGLGLFRRSPLWGIGYNGFADELMYTAHNSFLLCATELGMIGFFFWMALIIISAWQLIRIARSEADSSPELRDWSNAVFFSLVGFLTPGFFLSETYAAMLFMLLGMSAAIARMEMERSDGEVLPEKSHWAAKTMLACVGSMLLIYVMVRIRIV